MIIQGEGKGGCAMIEQVSQLFIQYGQPDKAQQMSAYMRHQFLYYGIQTPMQRELTKTLLMQMKDEVRLTHKINWDFIEQCWLSEYRELQYVALDYLRSIVRWLDYEDIAKLLPFITEKSWWDTIDVFDRLIGHIGLKDKRVNQLMLQWATDDNFWLRRIAIDHQLGRKDKTDTELLKQIIVCNLGTHEFFINKAIGWSLRDYSKSHPQWVATFIDSYRHQMSPLSIREASKYIK